MSHVTASPQQTSYTWTTSASQHPDQSATDDPPVVESVPRVDSFKTSDYFDNDHPVFSTDSAFHYNHPTPGDSADEITFHTPELDDLLWPQETHTLRLSNDILDQKPAPANHSSHQSHISGLASHKNSLPSPQSTNLSTPEASGGNTKPLAHAATLLGSPLSSPQDSRHQVHASVDDMDDMESAEAYLYTPAHQASQWTSPLIKVSRHSRGDSPARSDPDRSTTSKKRSASGLAQGEYFPRVDEDSQQSHLMPPHQNIMQEWEDAEDRNGLAPGQRGEVETQSFDDMEKQQEHEKSVLMVSHWLELTTVEPGAERRARTQRVRPDRIRSRSTGARPTAGQQPILMAYVHPGPGLEIDEESEYYYSTDTESQRSLVPDDHPETHRTELLPRRESAIAPENDSEPLPSQFIYRRPWQDPPRVQRPVETSRYQPDSSAAAMRQFDLRVREFDSASRAATWGTGRRRLSDGDLDSILGDNKTRHMSLTKSKMRERGISIVQEVKAKVTELKRSNSRSKQTHVQGQAELEKVQSPEPIEERSSSDSQPPAHHSSYPRPKSPSIGVALIGATSNLAAVGAASTGLNIGLEQLHEGFFKKAIRRVRSKSDVNKSPKSPSAVTPKVAQPGGGPAVPSSRLPGPEETADTAQAASPAVSHCPAQSPIKMPLSPRPANVMPNLEGFRVQVLELNPNLAPYLVDRIAHDQVRRYKRLVKNKVDHAAAVAEGKCASQHMCPAVGGQAEILPARTSGRDPVGSSAHFKVAAGIDSDNEDSAFDGTVTPAAFPEGIPLPPAKKLPARFECPLCFQVKSFQKPSDWTKHVHEDVQPFTCTFPQCPEPKSFKRKADWVRHENERHRHLEWWTCNLSDCAHRCYRKDNFVQHLVREHKRKEPKIKSRTAPHGKGKGKGTIFNAEEQAFWELVDSCRHEGTSDARQEPCKFCGNLCPSWKKLSVHVGKHMEQIAMPVLELAEKRNVTRDTIISPVEPLQPHAAGYGSDQPTAVDFGSHPLSPYTQSGASNYQSSSAGHSPALGQSRPGFVPGNGHLMPGLTSSIPRQNALSNPYPTSMAVGNPAYDLRPNYDETQYGHFHGQHMLYTPHNPMATANLVPRTSTMDNGYSTAGMHPSYDEQTPYFSSPQQHFSSYHSQMIPMDDLMDQNDVMQGPHLQMPVTTHDVNNHGYVYAQQQDQWGQHH